MNETAKQIFELLPKNGNSLSGGQIRAELGLSKMELKEAKGELKSAGVIECGRGRGGTIRLISQNLPKPTKTITPQERAQFARDSRKAQTQEQKKRDKIRGLAEGWAEKAFPNCESIEVQLWSDTDCFIYVWNDGEAKTYKVEIQGEEVFLIKEST